MPFKNFNTKQAFDESYSIGVDWNPPRYDNPPPIKLHYHRAVLRPAADRKAAGISQAMGWTAPGPSIVMVGAGFGWLAEAFEDLGFTRVVGIDISTHIQAEKDATEEAELDGILTAAGLDPASGIGAQMKGRVFDGGPRTRSSRGVLNANASINSNRVTIRQALGLSGNQRPDILLSESVLENFTDQEAVDHTAAIRDWGPALVHFVVTTRPGQTPGEFNWKTLQAWKTLLPLDTFIEAGTYQIL